MTGDHPLRRYIPSPMRLFALAVAYAAASEAADKLSDLAPDHLARIWFANGIAIGFLLVAPRRHWAAYLGAVAVGSTLISVPLEGSYHFYAILTAINLIEIWLAAYALRVLLGRADLRKRASLPPFLAFAVVLAPLATSVMAAVTMNLYYGRPLLMSALDWFVAGGIGNGIVTPVIPALQRGHIDRLFEPGRRLWTILYISAVTAVAVAVFSQSAYPLLFLVPPAMVLVAVQLGHAGVALMVPILTLIALTFSLSGHGPAGLNPSFDTAQSIQLTQLFIFVTSLLSFWIANSEAERWHVTHELRASVEKLAQLAAADGLTGLGNRRSFDETFNRLWRRALRNRSVLSIVMIDVDHFKAFNDHYGHLRGDDCLKRVAAETAQSLKRPGDHVFRYGGEEFVVVLPETDASAAAAVAEDIRSRIAAMAIPHETSRTSAVVTASLGTATLAAGSPAGGFAGPEAMIEHADRELYTAKRMGRNRVCAHEHRLLRAV